MSKDYTWMEYPNAEIWNNCKENSIEDCIKEAQACYDLKSGDSIWVGECEPVCIRISSFDSVLEVLEESVYEEVGEVSEGWNIGWSKDKERQSIIKKYDEKLNDLVEEYLKEIGEMPSFYHIVNEQEVKIP